MAKSLMNLKDFSECPHPDFMKAIPQVINLFLLALQIYEK